MVANSWSISLLPSSGKNPSVQLGDENDVPVHRYSIWQKTQSCHRYCYNIRVYCLPCLVPSYGHPYLIFIIMTTSGIPPVLPNNMGQEDFLKGKNFLCESPIWDSVQRAELCLKDSSLGLDLLFHFTKVLVLIQEDPLRCREALAFW